MNLCIDLCSGLSIEINRRRLYTYAWENEWNAQTVARLSGVRTGLESIAESSTESREMLSSTESLRDALGLVDTAEIRSRLKHEDKASEVKSPILLL